MAVANYGVIAAAIGAQTYLVAAVALDRPDRRSRQADDNAGMIRCAAIVCELEKYLVAELGIHIQATCSFVVLKRKAAPGPQISGLALDILGFLLVFITSFPKAPIDKRIAPRLSLLIAVIITGFKQIPGLLCEVCAAGVLGHRIEVIITGLFGIPHLGKGSLDKPFYSTGHVFTSFTKLSIYTSSCQPYTSGA